MKGKRCMTEMLLYGRGTNLETTRFEMEVWCYSESLPGDPLSHYKKKLPLSKVMAGGLDRRGAEGLRKKVQSMQKAKHPDAALLRNWSKLVQTAEVLQEASVPTLSAAELQGALAAVSAAEEVEWPVKVRQALLQRRVKQLTASGMYKELLDILDPWADEKSFDCFAPRLAGLGTAGDKKAEVFRDVVFKDFFADLVKQGPVAHGKLLEITTQCMQKFGDTDLLSASEDEAIVFDESCAAWRCLIALLTPSVDKDCVVLCSVPCWPCACLHFHDPEGCL
eukprot:6490620-Amphidinium_carterae.6